MLLLGLWQCVCTCPVPLLGVQFNPGPGDGAITVTRMRSAAWDLTNGIWRVDPVLVPKLPLPNGLAATLQPMKPAAIVQAIDSCSGWQVCGLTVGGWQDP
jgi:hypothetical protein